MNQFLQIIGISLIVVILSITVSTKEKELAMMISLSGILIIGIITLQFLFPVISFFEMLADIGEFPVSFLTILLKITGICLISQIAIQICSDSGNAAIGKMIQFFSNASILYLSLPVFQSLISLLQEILGKV